MKQENRTYFSVWRRVVEAFIGITASAIFSTASVYAQDAPSYAQPSYASDEESIHGRILSMNGTFGLSVRDRRGFVDAIALHKGTIINPIGLRLAPGMHVIILGHNSGSVFTANEIDTPYAYAHREYGSHTTVIVAPRFGW